MHHTSKLAVQFTERDRACGLDLSSKGDEDGKRILFGNEVLFLIFWQVKSMGLSRYRLEVQKQITTIYV